MESLERKDANLEPEEPLKTEEVVSNPDINDRNNSAPSPPPNCSICLGKLVNTSFTDSCLHQFCFSCLLQWSKIRPECPLCKQCFKSIIHNVRSEEDYDQYHVLQSQATAHVGVTATLPVGILGISTTTTTYSRHHPQFMVPSRAFYYRTTMGVPQRPENSRFAALERSGIVLNQAAVARREQIPSVAAPRVPRGERRHRSNNPIDYRRTVYRHGVYAEALPDAFRRLRECNADYYRRNPADVDRLIPWLNRELQVLLNNNQPHIAYVLNVITDTLVQYDISSAEFRNTVRPYFGIHTEHFAHELQNFARSNFDLVGYDQAVTYHPRRGLSNQFVERAESPVLSTSSSSSSDSDVLVVDNRETIDLTTSLPPAVSTSTRRLESRLIDMPGSSNAVPRLLITSCPMPLVSLREPETLTISSSSSESENECEVIGYVKPRHERTPEIIDLNSSEGEAEADAEAKACPTQSSPNIVVSEASLSPIDENLPSTSSACDLRASCRSRRQIVDKVEMFDEWATTPESDSDETDSDYNPTTKTRHYKSASKKIPKKSSRKSHISKKKKSSSSQRKRKDRRHRSPSSSDHSDNESTKKEEASSGRGRKRRLSKSPDESSSKKLRKKSKKTKKSKTKKSKKHSTGKPTYSSNCSSSTSSDECCSNSNDEESNINSCKSKKRKKSWEKPREKSSHYPARYSSDETNQPLEDISNNEVSSQQPEPSNCNDSYVQSSQPSLSTSRSADSELSDYRVSTPSARRSSIDSVESRKSPVPSNCDEFLPEEDEESRHTPPVSDEEAKTQSC